MNVHVQINVGAGEYSSNLSGNAEELANKILTAIGGDPFKDTVYVMINDSGSAGNVSPAPIPPELDLLSMTVNSNFTTQNTSPPGNKQTRTNVSSASDVTAVYVDDKSSEGNDISAALLALIVDDVVEIRGVVDPTRYAKFKLLANPIDQNSFVELPVSFLEEGGNLANGTCSLTFLAR